MNEILVISRISIGNRIVLSPEICTELQVGIGDKVVLMRNNSGEIVVRNAKAVA